MTILPTNPMYLSLHGQYKLICSKLETLRAAVVFGELASGLLRLASSGTGELDALLDTEMLKGVVQKTHPMPMGVGGGTMSPMENSRWSIDGALLPGHESASTAAALPFWSLKSRVRKLGKAVHWDNLSFCIKVMGADRRRGIVKEALDFIARPTPASVLKVLWTMLWRKHNQSTGLVDSMFFHYIVDKAPWPGVHGLITSWYSSISAALFTFPVFSSSPSWSSSPTLLASEGKVDVQHIFRGKTPPGCAVWPL
ncbi:hypothetical protein CERZMDRAFT_101857 [Cercospora zeae-maydis SCOH1-5]|uniref:Uncharacterized protein n=1 Tax=Cercospora zeae-maydis SCOH1-5 TaxID=717836 RepID=A0A6A6F2I9_9PEZI|nr:hypothetical protein CERZMDRAFT_101857 [Cercospora zeae-maydis SCOH1-5]